MCAICLGLGWSPQHLGRAKDISEYVKHGSHEGMVEVELAKRPTDRGGNPVIRRAIKREGNKSHFSIDGKQAPQKAVLELAKSFSIQIDNLCQFLPQDKVCEFAALTPVELLNSTQRAAAPEHMLEWHDHLKQFRAEQKKAQLQQATEQETLANLDGRQQVLRADVERLQERANIQKRLALLEKARPFAKYRVARLRLVEAKKKSKESQVELKKLEEEVEPSLRAVNRKQTYAHQMEKVVRDRAKEVERREDVADKAVQKQKELGEQIVDLNREIEAETDGDKQRKNSMAKIDGDIKRLERQLDEAPVEFDPLAYNEKIREKHRAIRDMTTKAQELRGSAKTQVSRGREKREQIRQAESELASLDSQAGQQMAKLKQISPETAQAWDWIQDNQALFEHRVYGPPILECSIKDPRYVDSIESLFQKNDFLTFTTQSRNDFRKLGECLYDRMRLAEINIRTSTAGLDQFRAPVSMEQLRGYGFEGWALDFIDGPEPVLAMLCGEVRLHQTAVTLRDVTERQYEALRDSPISNWVTSKASYQITRRREYGPGATSTRVRDIRRGRVWTDQPVDMSLKQELQANIDEWGREANELKRQADEVNDRLEGLRREAHGLEREKMELEDEKGVKQRAHSQYAALPTRLAQAREKLESLRQAGTQLRNRLQKVVETIDQHTLERGRKALQHADLVANLAAAHEQLLEAQIMAIEARSDVEALMERNRSVKDMLEARRRDVTTLVKEAEEANRAGRLLLQQCQRVLSDEDSGDEQREFLTTLPETQTPEELEGEIESERTRLELVHEGNPNAIAEYEDREKAIHKLRDRLERIGHKLGELEAAIAEIRGKWEPKLDELVEKISVAFSENFEKIGCAGQVEIYKDDDFDQWAIQIQVKFRENEQLSILDSHRQSGGERAVSTIFYLMALQSLSRAPFRVVDEINQGMDPRNERIVHERMVDIACGGSDDSRGDPGAGGEAGKGGSQYFLITPKLLHGLKYHRRMKIHCIASGEFMPGSENDSSRRGTGAQAGQTGGSGDSLDFGKLLEVKKALAIRVA